MLIIFRVEGVTMFFLAAATTERRVRFEGGDVTSIPLTVTTGDGKYGIITVDSQPIRPVALETRPARPDGPGKRPFAGEMHATYSYSKCRREFGRQCRFNKSGPTVLVDLPPDAGPEDQWLSENPVERSTNDGIDWSEHEASNHI